MLALVGALVVAAGVSGVTFFVWPTGVADRSLAVTPKVLDALRTLKTERKFVEDISHFYPGARNEDVRARSQAAVDAVIDSLIHELPSNPHRSLVLKTFKRALSEFSSTESEEGDQFLAYLQRIMSIVGIAGSGELFNVWRYGFPYGWIM